MINDVLKDLENMVGSIPDEALFLIKKSIDDEVGRRKNMEEFCKAMNELFPSGNTTHD